jgi:hypothetical protein
MTSKAEATTETTPQPANKSRRFAMVLLSVAGVFLVAIGVVYQPFNSEPQITNAKPIQTNMKEQVEFAIDSATGNVEEQAGGELRQLLSLVEKERKEARDNRRKLDSHKGSKGESGKGKGKGGKSSKGSKKGDSEMPSIAPTVSPAPSISSNPTSPSSAPSYTPTMDGSPAGRTKAPTTSPAPSISSEPTAPTISPAPSNAPTGSKGSKGSKGEYSGSKGEKRDRDRRLRELMDEADQAQTPSFKTGRRQLS